MIDLSDFGPRDGREVSISDPPIPLATLQRAMRLLHSQGIPALLASWESDEHTKGGRIPSVPGHAVLCILLALAMHGRPTHLTHVSHVLYWQARDERVASLLDLKFDSEVGMVGWYERARRGLGRLLGTIDAYPVPDRRTRMNMAQWRDLLAQRKADPRTQIRYSRARVLMNAILEATYQSIPIQYRPSKIDLAIDATNVPIPARGVGVHRKKNGDETIKNSIEPDAGYYLRDSLTHAEEKASIRKQIYAYELEIALTVPTPGVKGTAPRIALAVDWHLPGSRIGESARAMLESAFERKHCVEHVIADRAYLPNAKVDVFQRFLFDNDIKPVMDYPADQLGVQAQFGGAILVDGTWYSPSMPEPLRNLGKRRRQAFDDADGDLDPTLSKAERRLLHGAPTAQDFAERSKYKSRLMQGKDQHGSIKVYCPALGDSPTIRCVLREFVKESKRDLLLVIVPPEDPGKICTQSRVTIPASEGMKFRQAYEYGTEKWDSYYSAGRNAIESFNGYIKNHRFGLKHAENRRLRGSTAQFLLSTLIVAAANLTKIAEFLGDLANIAAGLPAGKARDRRGSHAATLDTHLRRQARRLSSTSASRGDPPGSSAGHDIDF